MDQSCGLDFYIHSLVDVKHKKNKDGREDFIGGQKQLIHRSVKRVINHVEESL